MNKNRLWSGVLIKVIIVYLFIFGIQVHTVKSEFTSPVFCHLLQYTLRKCSRKDCNKITVPETVTSRSFKLHQLEYFTNTLFIKRYSYVQYPLTAQPQLSNVLNMTRQLQNWPKFFFYDLNEICKVMSFCNTIIYLKFMQIYIKFIQKFRYKKIK